MSEEGKRAAADIAARLKELTEVRDDLLKAARRALNVLKAQGESVRPGNVLGALDDAISKAESIR